MRHPTAHSFLKWAGPSLVVFVGGCVGLVAALATSYPRVKDWGQAQFDRCWPTLSAPWFLISGAVVIVAFIWALVWTGQKTPSSERSLDGSAAPRLTETDRRRALIADGRAMIARFVRNTPTGNFQAFLNAEPTYLSLSPFLGGRVYAGQAPHGRTGYAGNPGPGFTQIYVKWFLADLVRLEREWELI